MRAASPPRRPVRPPAAPAVTPADPPRVPEPASADAEHPTRSLVGLPLRRRSGPVLRGGARKTGPEEPIGAHDGPIVLPVDPVDPVDRWSAGDPATAPGERPVAQRVAGGIAQAYKTAYGKGPEAIRVHITDDTVTALLRGGFTVVEESLVRSGRAEAVREQRRAFGDLVGPALGAMVTEVLGRDVAAVLADTCQHPDLTAIVVVFADRDAGGRA